MVDSTRNKILDEALVLFAEKGYKGANLRDLAARLGLSKSALYKHYDSKEHIWNALLDKMEAYYAAGSGSEEILPPTPASGEELVRMAMRMIRFTVEDPQIILTRKLLLTEQFHDERVRAMATRYFLEGKSVMFARLFERMMDNGVMRRGDPEMLALSFSAPVSTLIHQCDRDVDGHEALFGRMEAFMRYFIALHEIK